jgi:hypothetical protein
VVPAKCIGVNYEPHQIETVVREVLRRLAAIERSTVAGESAPGSGPPALDCRERLVTWAGLAPRLRGVQHVRFPRGAVVSPLVIDELRHRSINWSFETREEVAVCRAPRTLHIWGDVSPDTQACSELLVSQLTSPDVHVVVHLAGDPAEAASPGGPPAADLESGGLAVALARRPWRATCELNRHGAFRAVAIHHLGMLRPAYEELRPNVLVLDVQRLSAGQVLHAVRTYLSLAAPSLSHSHPAS